MASVGPEKVLTATHDKTVMEEIQRDSISDEKKSFSEQVLEASSIAYEDDEELVDFGTDDPFPVDPNAQEEQQFTFRAVFIGCALGAVISASK